MMSILKQTSKQSVFIYFIFFNNTNLKNKFHAKKQVQIRCFDESALASKTFARASLDSPVVYM